MNRLVLAVTLMLTLVGCGGQADAVLALTPSATNGATVFTANCARCHGPDGKGTTSGPSLVDTTKNSSKASIVASIINGYTPPGNVPNPLSMPSFAKELTNQQIADVAEYVKTTFGK